MSFAPKYISEDWPAMKTGLQAALQAELSADVLVVYGDQPAPAPLRSFVRLQELAKGSNDGFSSEQVSPACFQITEVVSNADYVFSVDGNNLSVNSGVSPTVDSIRLAIAAAIEALTLNLVLGSPRADLLSVAQPAGGDAPVLAATAPLDLVVVTVHQLQQTMAFSIDAYTAPDTGANLGASASVLASKLRLAFEKRTFGEALASAGFGFAGILSERRNFAIAGASRESRAGFDVVLTCLDRILDITYYIESFDILTDLEFTLTA